ncbi:hypothetical protein CWE09_00810 [Aliidiomarina minuta]|uniref:Uncharacterized protein n=1 Tax=Aliidiomarina minuta TaxID=880057 RepID=A0A432W5Q7_9GAMM|nr:hypothetical protein CWE09_00810 [Aliidiomarina minuta]
MITLVYLLFVIAAVGEFFLFGMQRTLLAIAYRRKVDGQYLCRQLLPEWFRYIWGVRGLQLLLLLFIMLLSGWKTAFYTLCVTLLLSSFLPVPFTRYYSDIFHRQARRVRVKDEAAGRELKVILKSEGI